MRGIKLVTAMFAILALTAIAASTASAAVEFLPGAAGTLFTDEAGESKLQESGGGVIKCKAATSTGELLNTTEALTIITFTGCTCSGFACNSLGAAASTIIVHAEIKTCAITTKPLVGGLLLKVLPIHIEVPAIGALIDITGELVIGVSPENKKTKTATLKVEQKEGKQAIEGCEGKKETLLSSLNGAEPKPAGQESLKASITFTTVEQEFMT